MDPHANLRKQRELAREIFALRESIPTESTIDADDNYRDMDEGRETINEDIASRADELAELVLALDDWRLSGGFDPYAVKSTRSG